MTCSLIAPVIAFRVQAQTTLASPSESHQTWALLALVLVGLILFVVVTGLLAWLARRVLSEPAQAHRHRRPLVPNAWGFDRGIDSDAAAADSVPHQPAP